jgi:hypothetical protein
MDCLVRDEQRHAELAWQFAAWAAEVGGASIRTVLHEAFEAAVAASGAPVVADAPDALHHPGHRRARLVSGFR